MLVARVSFCEERERERERIGFFPILDLTLDSKTHRKKSSKIIQFITQHVDTSLLVVSDKVPKTDDFETDAMRRKVSRRRVAVLPLLLFVCCATLTCRVGEATTYFSETFDGATTLLYARRRSFSSFFVCDACEEHRARILINFLAAAR